MVNRHGHPRFAIHQLLGDIDAAHAQFFGVPADLQRRCPVGKLVGLLDFQLQTGHVLQLPLNIPQPAEPPLPLRLVVALHPHFHRHQHADGLFLADLQRPREAVMGRAVHPRGLH